MDVRWTIKSFFLTLREHGEKIAVIVDSGSAISYRELLNCAAYNADMLDSLLYRKAIQPHGAVITIDLSLSWRAIPVMPTAAFSSRCFFPGRCHPTRRTE